MRAAFLLLTLTAMFVGCASRAPSGENVRLALPGIEHYKVDPYIRMAIELQSLGRTNALARLHSMAQARNSETRVIVLCRMLFAQRADSGFRSPRIGLPFFPGGAAYSDWPLVPIDLVDGIPFLVVRGYIVGGLCESDEMYLRYCETNCDWSAIRYAAKSEAQKQEALSKLLASPQWKNPLDQYEKKFFSEQTR